MHQGQMTGLVVGGGGREDAFRTAIEKSPLVKKVICAPGNGGTPPEDCRKAHTIADIVRLAKDVDFVVVGPEKWLIAGLVDYLNNTGIPVFGPTAKAAQLEGSKVRMKQFCRDYDIPTADWMMVDKQDAGYAAIDQLGEVVIKLDGLLAGKGVVVPPSSGVARDYTYNIFTHGCLGPDHISLENVTHKFVYEKLQRGFECSVTLLCDGKDFTWLPIVYDCKPVFLGGPNTGGMGGYFPVPYITEPMRTRIEREIVIPFMQGMRAEGTPYHGAVKFDLMITEQGPMVLEINVRFGDPETQLIMALLMYSDIDIFPYLWTTLEEGGLAKLPQIQMKPDLAAVSIALCSEGYPGKHESGFPITDIKQVMAMPDTFVFHGGTQRLADGTVVTTGGRVLYVVGLGHTVGEACERALQAAHTVHFPGKFYRKDIGEGVC